MKPLPGRCFADGFSSVFSGVELAGGQIAAQQVTEGQAVDAVAVAGDREVVGIGVHITDHLADVEEAWDDLVVLVFDLHVLVAAQAAHDGHKQSVVARVVEGAVLVDRDQERGILVEVLVLPLLAQLVIALDDRLELLGVEFALLGELFDRIGLAALPGGQQLVHGLGRVVKVGAEAVPLMAGVDDRLRIVRRPDTPGDVTRLADEVVGAVGAETSSR